MQFDASHLHPLLLLVLFHSSDSWFLCCLQPPFLACLFSCWLLVRISFWNAYCYLALGCVTEIMFNGECLYSGSQSFQCTPLLNHPHFSTWRPHSPNWVTASQWKREFPPREFTVQIKAIRGFGKILKNLYMVHIHCKKKTTSFLLKQTAFHQGSVFCPNFPNALEGDKALSKVLYEGINTGIYKQLINSSQKCSCSNRCHSWPTECN